MVRREGGGVEEVEVEVEFEVEAWRRTFIRSRGLPIRIPAAPEM